MMIHRSYTVTKSMQPDALKCKMYNNVHTHMFDGQYQPTCNPLMGEMPNTYTLPPPAEQVYISKMIFY